MTSKKYQIKLKHVYRCLWQRVTCLRTDENISGYVILHEGTLIMLLKDRSKNMYQALDLSTLNMFCALQEWFYEEHKMFEEVSITQT